jgi:hypothetical protein
VSEERLETEGKVTGNSESNMEGGDVKLRNKAGRGGIAKKITWRRVS